MTRDYSRSQPVTGRKRDPEAFKARFSAPRTDSQLVAGSLTCSDKAASQAAQSRPD